MVSERQKKVTPIKSPSYIDDRSLLEKVRKKRRRGLVRRLAVFFILIAVAAVVMTQMITSQHHEIAQKQARKAEVEQKLADLQKQGHELKGKVKKLKDPEYIGKIARRDYYMTGEGELVFTTSEGNGN